MKQRIPAKIVEKDGGPAVIELTAYNKKNLMDRESKNLGLVDAETACRKLGIGGR